MKRQINLDILKTIGLFCIILAHVVNNKIIFQLRNFDVVLMILISSKLYLDQNKKINSIKEYCQYIFKRIKRLVFPTYIFLTILFILNCIFNFSNWSIKQIILSYALQGGIGYVWIIRIYLIIAILLPFFDICRNKYKDYIILVYSTMLFIIYEILCYYGIFDNKILEYLFAYIIPCWFLISITNYIKSKNEKTLLLFSLICFIIFAVSGFIIYKNTGFIHNTNYMKYPFRTYYLSYAIGASMVLIAIFRNNNICKLFYNKFIGFCSRNSLWIYLWHILFLQIFKFNNYIVNYILIITYSLVIMLIQNKIIEYLKTKKINKNILQIFQG